MARQPDLLAAELKLKLPARTEPRLWLRRLAIWEDLNKDPIREIGLHPGLNVIWSPDAATGDANRAIGHGSGKTLFCRLIRYCLGEDRFADEDLRAKIALKFPDGWVGAEVMLDGECWAVMRPIGSLRRHAAERGKTLEELRQAGPTNTGLGQLIGKREPGTAAVVCFQLDGVWLRRRRCRVARHRRGAWPAASSCRAAARPAG